MARFFFLLAPLLVGCVGERSVVDAAKYFRQEKIGTDRDYGIVKFNEDAPVVAVYGFMDDYSVCRTIAKALNEDACAETSGQGCLNPFSCAPLNQSR